jgi:hypothetical protein
MVVCVIAVSAANLRADIMDVDVSGVAPAYRQYFLSAEQFWENRILGYQASLPRIVTAQLGKLQIAASTANIDGQGGILGQAGPTDILTYSTTGVNSRQIAIARRSQMQFDNADLADLVADGTIGAVIRHEMAHALGFGSLWTQNGLLTTVNGVTNYTGARALQWYRIESNNSSALFVPIEQDGGGGTALAHWDDDDPLFSRRPNPFTSDLMIGDIAPGEQKYTTETTWAAFADLHFVVQGINDGPIAPVGGGRRTWPKWTGLDRPIFILGSVPEPASLSMLGLTLAGGLSLRRRRK